MTEEENSASTETTAAASLEILTGPARGTASWLGGSAHDISLNDADMIRVGEAGSEPLQGGIVARLHRSGEGYEIEARQQAPLWINGERVESKQLQQRDLIEFGDKGPLARYRIHRQGDRLKKSLGDMLADCIDYTRVSRKPRIARLNKALRDLSRDFLVETTLWFRVTVVIALVTLAVITYQQYRAGLELQQRAASSADRLEDFARSLTRTLRPADLNRLRQELSHSLSDAAQRLEQLEQRSEASIRIIAEATRSIVFLQGAFAFRDSESKRMLRYAVNDEGNPLFTLRGQPLLTLEGDGEVAESRFTGTGFVVSKSGAILTNRHVALPWEEDSSLEALVAEGIEPVLIKLVGYLPDIEAAFPVELLKASDNADLAVLLCSEVVSGLPQLKLSMHTSAPGDEVIVMGYPTGMRSMLAQTGDDFLAELQQDEDLDFWRPLASRGIVGQRSESAVVYDADTTHGGSGGPVLDIDGNVIAVNTAIIPEYGGSNFGIPVEYARQLLADAGIAIEQ